MTRELITEVIEKHLKNAVEGLDETMDPSKRFLDYGANSLDIVEIVSGAMRELKVKIPRTELGGIQNIAGLIDKFEECAK